LQVSARRSQLGRGFIQLVLEPLDPYARRGQLVASQGEVATCRRQLGPRRGHFVLQDIELLAQRRQVTLRSAQLTPQLIALLDEQRQVRTGRLEL
jgi:hypothetical protein